MADQDFNINIRTLADLTGIRLTEEQLNALKTAAADGNKEAIAALKKLEQAQKDAIRQQKEAEDAQVRGIRNASTYGLLIGGFLASAINKLAEAENKVTQELDAQLASVVRSSKEWADLSSNVENFHDAASLAGKASSEIEKIGDTFNKVNNESKGFWHGVAENALTAIGLIQPQMARASKTFIDLMNDPKNRELQGLQTDRSEAQQAASRAIINALREEQAIHQNIGGVIAKETQELERQKRTLAGIPVGMEQAWAAQAKIVDDHERKLNRLRDIQLRNLQDLKKEVEQAVSSASPQTKAVLMQEQAERKARSEGDQRSADQFAKAAEDFKRSMTDAQLAELNRIHNIKTEDKDSKTARAIDELRAYMQGVWGM